MVVQVRLRNHAVFLWYHSRKASKLRLKASKKMPCLRWPSPSTGLSRVAHKDGDRISATMMDKDMAETMVMENWREINPGEPPEKAMGRDTAARTSPEPIL